LSASPFITRPAGPPVWALGALAVVLVSGLLLAFLQVLHASVAQGALRRQTLLDQDAARWNCDRLPQRQARAECRARLPDAASSPSTPIT
jgi:hypothetical protein